MAHFYKQDDWFKEARLLSRMFNILLTNMSTRYPKERLVHIDLVV